MDGLIQYCKAALEEEIQVVFLQSAHCLVKEIENTVPSIFQPSPRLREDPLSKIHLNFDEMVSVLQGLVPSLIGIMKSENEAEKYPYSFNSETAVQGGASSTQVSKQRIFFQSSSSNSLFDLAVLSKDTLRRPNSNPSSHPTQSKKVCACARIQLVKLQEKRENIRLLKIQVHNLQTVTQSQSQDLCSYTALLFTRGLPK